MFTFFDPSILKKQGYIKWVMLLCIFMIHFHHLSFFSQIGLRIIEKSCWRKQYFMVVYQMWIWKFEPLLLKARSLSPITLKMMFFFPSVFLPICLGSEMITIWYKKRDHFLHLRQYSRKNSGDVLSNIPLSIS